MHTMHGRKIVLENSYLFVAHYVPFARTHTPSLRRENFLFFVSFLSVSRRLSLSHSHTLVVDAIPLSLCVGVYFSLTLSRVEYSSFVHDERIKYFTFRNLVESHENHFRLLNVFVLIGMCSLALSGICAQEITFLCSSVRGRTVFFPNFRFCLEKNHFNFTNHTCDPTPEVVKAYKTEY